MKGPVEQLRDNIRRLESLPDTATAEKSAVFADCLKDIMLAFHDIEEEAPGSGREEVELKVDWEEVEDLRDRITQIEEDVAALSFEKIRKLAFSLQQDIRVLEMRVNNLTRILRDTSVRSMGIEPSNIYELRKFIVENTNNLEILKRLLTDKQPHSRINDSIIMLEQTNQRLISRVDSLMTGLKDKKTSAEGDSKIISELQNTVKSNTTSINSLKSMVEVGKPHEQMQKRLRELEEMNSQLLHKVSDLSQNISNAQKTPTEPMQLKESVIRELLDQNMNLINNINVMKTELKELSRTKGKIDTIKSQIALQKSRYTG